jgi:hypothetical protein
VTLMTVTDPYTEPQPLAPPATVTEPPKKRPTRLIVAAIAAGVVVLVGLSIAATIALTHGGRSATATAGPAATSTTAGWCGPNGCFSTPTTMTVTGSLLLTYSTGVLNLDDVNCQGMGPYDDIKPGSQVVITDQSGAVVATAALGTGKLIGSGLTRQCQFSFTANSVPKGHTFYGIQLGRRGSIQYTESDLDRGPQLKLGP